MTIGPGLDTGSSVERWIGIRPGDVGYIGHEDATFYLDNESQGTGGGGGGGIGVSDGGEQMPLAPGSPYYAIDTVDAAIEFTVEPVLDGDHSIGLELISYGGGTAFTLEEIPTGMQVITAEGAVDTNRWFIQARGPSGKFRLTDFVTNTDFNAREANWYPFVGVHVLQEDYNNSGPTTE